MTEEKKVSGDLTRETSTRAAIEQRIVADNSDGLQRHLGNRQIQLIAIGGSIGTALFVSIGGALNQGGPLGMLIAYTGYSGIIALVNNAMAEMGSYMPVSGGFIRMAGHWVDDALGFTAGWNFFLYEALLIPFEITALNIVLKFWRDDIPVAAVCAAVIVLYAACNILAVRAYGEAEFWLSGGKVLLIFILYVFTFVTMVGGNPRKDAYGFRYECGYSHRQKRMVHRGGCRPTGAPSVLTGANIRILRYWVDPGPMNPHDNGDLGRFEGFLGSLWAASFCIVGPEYISMVSGEAKRPRVYIKDAFKTIYWRFGAFFILGSLCAGIVIAYNDPALLSILEAGESSAAASPYVIAMRNLGIDGLPHLVNALLITSIFSAGNTLAYCATRSLYSLAIEGRAPRFLRKCTKNGVPIYCFLIVMCFPFLSFLQLSDNSAKVLTWLTNIITAGGIINYIIMCGTYLAFYRACKAQGLDRNTLPYRGYFQPYGTWVALAFEITVVFVYGYSTFKPGNFTAESFLTYYTMVGLAPIFFVFWKVTKKTKWLSPHEVDLTWDAPLIDTYESSFITPPVTFWTEMLQLVGLRRHVPVDERIM